MAAGHGGRDGRWSGAGKVDDSGDEARGRDARIPVRSRGCERSISCNGRRRRGISSGMVEEDGGGWGGGRRRVGWRGCFGAHGVRMGKREVERKGQTMYLGRACLKCDEIYKLSPRFKFLLHHSNISRLGIGR